ncbi:MAG: hypothetical protein ACFCU5_19530 [Pleurocapsa sp.]
MWYLWGILIFFCYWLMFFLKDNTTPKTHLLSWMVLVIAAIIWPVSAPLAIRELINKAKNKQNKSEIEIVKTGDISKTVESN